MRLLLIYILLFVCQTLSAQVIWLENFNGLANGTTVDNGATAWSIDLATYCSGSVSGSFDVQNNELVANDTDCDAIWQSEWIDIQAFALVQISATLDGAGSLDAGGGNPDTCKVGYRVNGGTGITWLDEYAGTAVINSVSCGGTVSGDSIQVVVQSSTTGGDEFHYIDDVSVSVASTLPTGGGDTLFSRQSGDWDQTSTWSNTENGASCSCTPNSSSVVYITCGETVNIDADGDAKHVNILFNGRLEWGADDVELNLHDDALLIVNIGGELDENGQGSAAIDFEGTGNCTIQVYDETVGIDIDLININDNGSFVFEGTGRMNITDDLDINAAATITNNMTSTFTIDDDIRFDASNITFNNNGFINVDDRFDINASDMDFTNSDSLYIGGDIDGNNADDGQFTNDSTGWVHVDGDDIELSNNSDNFRIDNFGVFVLDDDLKESGTGAVACEFHNRPNGYFFIGHNDAELDWELYANYDSNTVDYYRGGDQARVFQPEDAYWNLTISGSGIKRTISDLDINGTVRIAGNAQFDVDNGDDDLTVAGNWRVTSAVANPFDFGTETVTFDGTGRQVVDGNDDAEFYNVIVNKPDTLALSSIMIVNSGANLTLTDGHLLSDSIDRLMLEDNVTTSGASNASFIDGRVEKIGDEAFTFPVGDNGDLQTIGITAPTTATHSFTAQYFQKDQRIPYGETKAATINHVSTEEYWILNRTNGASSVNVTLSWDANSGGVDDIDSLVVARWNGTFWTDGGNGSTTGNTTAGTVTSNIAFTTFSPFTLGSTINDYDQNPLPIELVSINADCIDDMVSLSWTVASERDLDYYLIEGLTESGSWTEVKKVNSVWDGNTHTYQEWIRKEVPILGKFRLNEITRNAKTRELTVVEADCYEPVEGQIRVNPNPTTGLVNVAFEGYNVQDIVIYSAHGQLLKTHTIAGMSTSMDFSEYDAGVYLLVANLSNGDRLTSRVVVR